MFKGFLGLQGFRVKVNQGKEVIYMDLELRWIGRLGSLWGHMV
jgi:hypothetical protein